ncbi:ribosomal protein S12 methylthiotransferase accessory factor [Archangium gephyra]|uniref:AknN n=1 Tax=Archangium gephyra TaxID=48 RepID=A0AAC8TDJ4_9BACT|nr:TOMM precursor leader peptide-binding protein [Archangium gephyra]AKJ00586.1 AknN [Archangium gephyra]REG32719.1 ribosomal protein S12 methylthiotransferase accessory factor [Archangium gephyra]
MGDPLDRKLRFPAHLRLARLEEDRFFLFGERERYRLSGHVLGRVAPLLDGTRTVGELLAELEGQVSPFELFYLLEELERGGSLVEAWRDVEPERAAFWQSLGVGPELAEHRLAEASVALHVLGGTPEPLREALETAGVPVREDGALSLVLVDSYLDPGLEALNRRHLEQGSRWMPVKLSGVVPWAGPVFHPGGACWGCLAHRLRANQPVEELLRARSGAKAPLSPPRASTPGSVGAAVHLVALSLSRWFAQGGRGVLEDALLAFDLGSLRTTEHTVTRRPQCAVCGDPELLVRRASRPLVLESRPKRFTEDGGHRCVPPEETFSRLQGQISPLTGVISSLAPAAGRDHALRPVYAATWFRPASGPQSTGDFHGIAAGKGRTPAQARASALCEAIERHSALFQGDEPRVRARASSLGDEALAPPALLGFSEAQYRNREDWNARCGDPRRAIPLPFDERLELDWTPAWSLTHERRRYLPAAYCYTGHPVAPEAWCCVQDSNGHAAGNCLEEAILQGFLELVERDAAGLWWYNRLPRPAVALESLGVPYFQELREHYAALGWRLWVLDLTTGLGIPAFAALGTERASGRFCAGFGAHLDARLGVQRALTELNQTFDPLGRQPPPWDAERLGPAAFLFPEESLPPRTREDFPRLWQDDLRDDVRACVSRAASAGLETLVVELTRPDVGLHAVKVVVPGLCHAWPRLGTRRLYEAPVQQGLRRAPLTEEQLNPVPLFL